MKMTNKECGNTLFPNAVGPDQIAKALRNAYKTAGSVLWANRGEVSISTEKTLIRHTTDEVFKSLTDFGFVINENHPDYFQVRQRVECEIQRCFRLGGRNGIKIDLKPRGVHIRERLYSSRVGLAEYVWGLPAKIDGVYYIGWFDAYNQANAK